jgi:formate-dependent nitrite reductase membrane component NrfD
MGNSETIAQKYHKILLPLTHMRWPFLITAGFLSIIFLWSFFAFGWQYVWGLGVTGMGHPMSWTLYLVNFVFFIGISHAGTLISAILRITNAGWRTPITRAAEVVTVFALAAGPTNILFDLGRSVKFHWVAIHAQFKSPLLWDFTCIMTYFVTCVLFLYVLMIPDIALLRERFPRRRWVYQLLSLGWTGTERQERILKKTSAFLCIAVIPVAVSVHTVVSWVFGMQKQPMWNSTIFGPYFVVGAIYSGIAAIILVAAILRKVYHLQNYLQPIHFNNLGLLLLRISHHTLRRRLGRVGRFLDESDREIFSPVLANGLFLLHHPLPHPCNAANPNHSGDIGRFRLGINRNVVGALPDHHSYFERTQASLLCARGLYAFMGGMVDVGRPLCRICPGPHPLFKILPNHFYLGDGKGGARKS